MRINKTKIALIVILIVALSVRLGIGIFLGFNSGYNESGSDKLYIDNSTTASPLIYGDFSNNLIRINN